MVVVLCVCFDEFIMGGGECYWMEFRLCLPFLIFVSYESFHLTRPWILSIAFPYNIVLFFCLSYSHAHAPHKHHRVRERILVLVCTCLLVKAFIMDVLPIHPVWVAYLCELEKKISKQLFFISNCRNKQTEYLASWKKCTPLSIPCPWYFVLTNSPLSCLLCEMKITVKQWFILETTSTQLQNLITLKKSTERQIN